MQNTIFQLYLLGIYTLSGIVIGLFFDTFRILRKSFKTSDLITYIEDIIFWIITGTFILFVVFKFNNGQIRNYTILGLISGIIIYILTISKYFIKFNVKIINVLKKIILKIILKPIMIVLKPIIHIINIIIHKFTNFIKIRFKNVLNNKNTSKMQKTINN